MPAILAEGQRSLFVPKSDWMPPSGDLPALRGVEIGLDTETHDLGLENERGPGWVKKDGCILGVSVAWDGGRIYVPTRHPETECRPMEQVVRWVDGLLRECHVCFFNMGYDMGWLQAEGCRVWPERADDGSVQSVLLDENWDTYNLDDCCRREGLPGKDETLLREAAAAYGVQPRHGSIKHGLWKLPGRYVGPYAETDAEDTLRLCRHLRPRIAQEHLVEAYQTEIDLIPVVVSMRRRGIPVRKKRAEEARERVRGLASEALAQVETPSAWRRRATIDDLRSPGKLAEIFDEAGVQYPRTAKMGLPSFTKQWLLNVEHPVGKRVQRARALDDLGEKFIGNYILGFEQAGRIHAEVHALRDDSGGARTLRFSYSAPPLQQMPSRDPELAPLIRGIFEAEPGTEWLAADYKYQEPLLTAHYAHVSRDHARRYGIDMGDTDQIVDYYRNDPSPDPHTLAAKMLSRPRRVAKDLNLGLTYRMGYRALAGHLNLTEEEAETLWREYHSKMPFADGLARFCERRGQEKGYIRMIDGARRHFPLWQPRHNREKDGYARLDAARLRWPGQTLERAFAYQAGNSLIQGSAARQTKRAMVSCYREGHQPVLQMHDEIDFFVTSGGECRAIGEIMCSAIKLVVPSAVDLEVGPTWGLAKKDYREYFS